MKKTISWLLILCLLLPSPMMSEALAGDVDISDVEGVSEVGKDPNAGKDMMKPFATGKIEHLPMDGNYKYPEDTVHDPNDPEWSGRKEGQRCNFSAQHEKPCDSGLECVEEFNQVKWQDAPKQCHFYDVPCQGSDKSPRQRCFIDCKNDSTKTEAQCQARCGPLTDKCSYRTDCLYSYLIPLEGEKVPHVMQCTAHSQCSSGYCMKLEGVKPGQKVNGVELPADLKVCMPYSKCTQPCLEDGENLAPGRVCCAGLLSVKKSGVNICSNPVLNVPDVPKEIKYEISGTCKGKLWEVDQDGAKVKDSSGAVDHTIVAKKNWTFSRYLAGVEWLWGESERSGLGERSSRADFFKLNENARKVTQDYRTKRLAIDKDYLKVMVKLEKRKEQLLTEAKGNNAGTSNDVRKKNEGAGGVAFMQLMSEHLSDVSGIHNKKVTLFADHLAELKGNLEVRAGQPEILEDGDPHYKYDKYGKRDWIMYCEAWFPHCWFSENSCGTYFQKNKVCVNEVWDTQGSGSITRDEKRYILDPIYPAALKHGGGAHGKDLGDEVGDRLGAAATGALVGALVFGPVGLVLGAIFGALFGSWSPKFYDWYNNDMEKLFNAIRTHLGTYADKPFDAGGDQEVAAYVQKNGVHYIPEMLSKDEIELKLKEASSNLSPEEIKQVLRQLDVPKMRKAGVDTVADFARLHLLTFSASDEHEYKEKEDKPAPNRHLYRTRDLVKMTEYLMMYHTTMTAYTMEMSACYTMLANKFHANMGNHGVNIQTGSVNLGAPDSAAFQGIDGAFEIPDVQKDCTGGSCVESGLAAGGLGGIDSLGGVAEGKAGVFASSERSSRGSTGAGLSSSANSGSLAAARRKRADFLKSRGLSEADIKGRDREGSDRLFSDLSRFDGARALAARLTGQSSALLPFGGSDTTASTGGGGDSGAGKGSGSGGEGDALVGKSGAEGAESDGNYKLNLGLNYGGSKGRDIDDSSGGRGTHDQLLQDLEREKKEYSSKETDGLFKRITNAYILYAFPRLLKKKEAAK